MDCAKTGETAVAASSERMLEVRILNGPVVVGFLVEVQKVEEDDGDEEEVLDDELKLKVLGRLRLLMEFTCRVVVRNPWEKVRFTCGG